MTRKKTNDEIKQALIADAANPDAWEMVAVVAPSTSPRPSWYGKQRQRKEAQVAENVVYNLEEARAKRRAGRSP